MSDLSDILNSENKVIISGSVNLIPLETGETDGKPDYTGVICIVRSNHSEGFGSTRYTVTSSTLGGAPTRDFCRCVYSRQDWKNGSGVRAELDIKDQTYGKIVIQKSN